MKYAYGIVGLAATIAAVVVGLLGMTDVTRFDYSHALLGRNTMPKEVSGKPLQAEWSALREGGFERIASPEQIEEFLVKAGTLDAERTELLKDYRHYEKTGEHRRPDVRKQLHDREQ